MKPGNSPAKYGDGMEIMQENEPFVIQLPGEWDLARREELETLLQPAYDRPLVVIDLSKTEYIDSTVLGALARMRKARVEERGFEPSHIVASRENIVRLLRIVGFHHIFPTYSSLPDALRDFFKPEAM